MLNKPVPPCKDCTKRKLYCHSIYTTYQEYEKLNEEYKQARNIDKEYHDYKDRVIAKANRKKLKHYKQSANHNFHVRRK